jgi:enamine deaminase RidA (YjgF/YER057c/UK114 family)
VAERLAAAEPDTAPDRHAFEAADASMADIVEPTVHHRDVRGGLADFPSWTAIGVTQLAAPEYVIEVKAVAVAGCGD